MLNTQQTVARRLAIAIRLILSCQLVVALTGCAFLNRDNTPALNAVEKRLWPQSTGKRVAAFPLVFPIGLAAIVTDAFVIHPLTVVDDAAEDTKDCLWEDWDWDDQYVTECAVLPWRAVFTPVVFAFDLLGRSMFDVPSRAAAVRARASGEDALSRAQALLAEGKPGEALDQLKDVRVYDLKDEALAARIDLTMLKAARKTGRFEDLNLHRVRSLLEGDSADETESILCDMEKSDDPYERWAAFDIKVGSAGAEMENLPGALEAMKRVLADPNPVVRHLGLQNVEERRSYHKEKAQAPRPEIERMAREDADPMNRALARRILRRIESRSKD
jgi:hypothetical protein